MNGKPKFIDGLASKRINPLAVSHVEFDFTEVERSLGELETEADRDSCARFVRAVFLWATEGVGTSKLAQAVVGRRIIALAWVLDPSFFDGSPSATKLAERIGILPHKLHKITGEASRRFSVTNRAQDHAWNREGNHAAP